MEERSLKSGERSSFLIFPAIQWPIILGGLLGVILSSSFYYIYLNKILFRISREVGGPLGHLPEVRPLMEVIAKNRQQFPEYVILVTVILILIQVLVGLLISHRFAGPMYRMLCYLRENQNVNELKKLQFREGDKLGELSLLFNKFLQKMGVKFRD